MKNYRSILKRVGIVLIALGIIDLVYFFHVRPAAGQSYSSSSIILTIVGVMFLRGYLRAVPFVIGATALLLSYFVGSLLVLPLQPAQLLATQWELEPVILSLWLLYKIAAIAACLWVYVQLQTESVRRATLKVDRLVDRLTHPKMLFILGLAFILLVAGSMELTRRSESGIQALEIAQVQHGKDYQYYLTGIRWQEAQVRANLIAYNDREIKPVTVEWNRQ